MPATSSVTTKYSEREVKATLLELSRNLQKHLQHKRFTEREISVACSDEYKDLSWLSHQETNSILNCPTDEEKISLLCHRIRFSLLPSLRIASRVPAYILIEPTSVCNLRCPMCFQTDKTFTTNEFMGKMDLAFFKSITNSAASDGIGAITLASRGEPTLHPDLEKMLAHLKDKFIEKKLNTNATRLTEAISRAILESGFNHIIFSCDSHLKEEYEQLRKGASFETVFNNIKSFWALRNSDEFINHKLRVSISGVKVIDSQNEEEFSKFWSSYCDDAYLNPAEERWDTYFNSVHPDITDSCIYPWERLYVWHDGTLNPCDVDYKSLLSPGNIKDFESIEHAWNKLSSLREAHLNNQRCNFAPCDRCGVSH